MDICSAESLPEIDHDSDDSDDSIDSDQESGPSP